MGKMSTAILKKGDEVEVLATISRSSGCWAPREKVFEIINRGGYDYSLSSVSNDLVALLEMGVIERAKPPKNRFFGYYVVTTTLSDAIQLPAPETIQDPVYQGNTVDVINPFTGEVDRI
jgi:DNA-binding transcriptional ArsR family regulator